MPESVPQSPSPVAASETLTLEHKSLRYALDRTRDMDGLACDCVGLANGAGGLILLGIEDGAAVPPQDQHVPPDLAERLSARIPQITANVRLAVNKLVATNGGQYVAVQVARSEHAIASTSDGRYFIRVADETRRLLPDDLGRLFAEKSMLAWELQTTLGVPAFQSEPEKLQAFEIQIRGSDRVSDFVKAKSQAELLGHYLFVRGDKMTNLGVLWLGCREHRAALAHAPVIQCVKFNERGQKVRKQTWTDYDLNPLEMIERVWREVPEWKEAHDLPDGLFRKSVPHYDEVVIRELLANALVHRPYTQRGDIFLNLYPDRLEVHNPGLLPIGVTPRNILHAASKRNPHLAKVFYDLKLMEGEGSGFDRMYEVLLCTGRPAPDVHEGDDRVVVTVRKRLTNPVLVDFVAKADQAFELTQKERITLGLLVQHEAMTAIDLGRSLDLRHNADVRHWLGRLADLQVVHTRGHTKATEYFVNPEFLRTLEFKGRTSLKGIEGHRLRELLLRDLEIYKQARISEIHARIGPEIPRRKLRHGLDRLLVEGVIASEGARRWKRYLWTKRL